jgi:hypothetical protein
LRQGAKLALMKGGDALHALQDGVVLVARKDRFAELLLGDGEPFSLEAGRVELARQPDRRLPAGFSDALENPFHRAGEMWVHSPPSPALYFGRGLRVP